MDSSHFWYGIPTHKNWTVIIGKAQKPRRQLAFLGVLKESIKELYKRTYAKENRASLGLMRGNSISFSKNHKITSAK
jgi:hypothetical protein